MPLFSIITTVYNNEQYIVNAVESVIGQDFTDYEYIIVDDGSTDGTPQIIDSIAERHEKVHVIHQKNQWIYAGFNNGIKAAQGDYVYILNSDDRLRDGSLRKMAQIVEEYEPDVIWTKVLLHRCDREQHITEFDCYGADQKVKKDLLYGSGWEFRKGWLFLTETGLNQNQANLYRRSLMQKHPFRNDVYGADILFNISIADEVRTAFVMKDAVYDFMIYDSGFMNVSVNKYYSYIHEMYNEIYCSNISL